MLSGDPPSPRSLSVEKVRDSANVNIPLYPLFFVYYIETLSSFDINLLMSAMQRR